MPHNLVTYNSHSCTELGTAQPQLVISIVDFIIYCSFDLAQVAPLQPVGIQAGDWQ